MKQLLVRTATAFMALGILFASPVAVLAQSPFEDAQDDLREVGESAEIQSDRSLPDIVGSIINIILGFLGIVLLVLILYAGFLWMTAGGNDEKVKEARGIIGNAIMGLIIVVAAFAISNFVLTSLVEVTQ